MLDKYHLKSNRKIEVKYLEHSHGKQGKWKKGEEINFQSSQKIPGSSLPSLSSGILPVTPARNLRFYTVSSNEVPFLVLYSKHRRNKEN